MQRKTSRALLVVFALVLALVMPAPVSVFADTPPNISAGDVCAIYVDGVNDVGYLSLADAVTDALAGSGDSYTIYLLSDITEDSLISIDAPKLIVISLGAHDLDIGYEGTDGVLEVTDPGARVQICNQGNLLANHIFVRSGSLSILDGITTGVAGLIMVDDSSTFVADGDINAGNTCIVASGASVEIKGNVHSAGYCAVGAGENSLVTIEGNITCDSGTAVSAASGAKVAITGDIKGAWNYGGWNAVYAVDSGTKISITGNIVDSYAAITASDGAEVTLTGSIISCGYGVSGDYPDTIITVTGSIQVLNTAISTRTLDSAAGTGFTGVTITINGDIIAGDNGVRASGSGNKVTVNGKMLVIKHFYPATGVMASDGVEVYISGDVTVEGGAETTGVLCYGDGAKVTIGGTLSCVSGEYIVFSPDGIAFNARTFEDHDAVSNKAGYLQYSGNDPLSWVWVRDSSNNSGNTATPITRPTTPATGDASIYLWAFLLSSSLLAVCSLVIRRSLRYRNSKVYQQ